MGQAAAVVFTLQGRAYGPPDQYQPDEHAGNQQQLPNPPQLDILITLMTEKESISTQQAINRNPGSGQTSDNNDDKRRKQRPYTSGLTFWFSADEGSDKKSGGQKTGGDKKDGQLDMPSARRHIRQNACQGNAVKCIAFHRIMGRQ